MKNTIKAGVVGLGLAAALAVGLGSGTANATMSTVGDPDDYSGYNYSVELKLAGLTSTDTGLPLTPRQAAALARRICSERMSGETEDQITDEAIDQGPMSASQSVSTVLGGEYHFCHAYEHDGSIGHGHGAPSPGTDI
jgi:hypothetical protein